MLISKALAKAFNQQIGHEFGASMQYVSIAAHFQQRKLQLLAKLFFDQALQAPSPCVYACARPTPSSIAVSGASAI